MKFSVPNLEVFLKACSQSVSGNKREFVARPTGCENPHTFSMKL